MFREADECPLTYAHWLSWIHCSVRRGNGGVTWPSRDSRVCLSAREWITFDRYAMTDVTVDA